MKTLSYIPRLFHLLLLLGFFQAVAADSSALPVREPQPVAQICAAGDPPGDQRFPDLPALPVVMSREACGPPVQVVRVLAVPWCTPAPKSEADRLVYSGLSPPLFLS